MSQSCFVRLHEICRMLTRTSVSHRIIVGCSFQLCRSVYFLICVCSFLHNLAFYHLTRLSAVMAGINKAVQAVSVFAFSHLCYCDIDAQQCLTSGKVVAMTLVVLGVILFSIGAYLFSPIALQVQVLSWS